MLRNKGIATVLRTAYLRIKLKPEIYLRGPNRNVNIDGCTFPLRHIPNTSMKLELLTGGYEKPEREAARRYIRKEWPVVELGGCIGVVSCVTNKLLAQPQAHVVLEANPVVLPHLESNRDANRCSFKIVNRALAYDADTVTFNPLRDFWGNSLRPGESEEEPVTVPTTRLSHILEDERFEKFALICDIEGQEYELVMHEPDALRKAELIIMEIHPHIIGERKAEELLSQLGSLGFETIDRSALVVVLRKSQA